MTSREMAQRRLSMILLQLRRGRQKNWKNREEDLNIMSEFSSFVFSVGASFKPLQNEAGSTTASTVQTTTETSSSSVNHPDPDHNNPAATSTSNPALGSSGGDQGDNKADTETSTNSSPVKSTASKAAAFLSAKMSSTESKKSAKSPEDCKSIILFFRNYF